MKKVLLLMMAMLILCMLSIPAIAETTSNLPATTGIDLTPLFRALIALLAAIVTKRLIPWIKEKTTNEQQTRLRAAINTAVYAAEQIYGAGHGPEKLSWAKSKLADMGFNIDSTEVLTGIEAAVKAMQMV